MSKQKRNLEKCEIYDEPGNVKEISNGRSMQNLGKIQFSAK